MIHKIYEGNIKVTIDNINKCCNLTTKLGLLLSVDDTYFEDYEYVIFVRKVVHV